MKTLLRLTGKNPKGAFGIAVIIGAGVLAWSSWTIPRLRDRETAARKESDEVIRRGQVDRGEEEANFVERGQFLTRFKKNVDFETYQEIDERSYLEIPGWKISRPDAYRLGRYFAVSFEVRNLSDQDSRFPIDSCWFVMNEARPAEWSFYSLPTKSHPQAAAPGDASRDSVQDREHFLPGERASLVLMVPCQANEDVTSALPVNWVLKLLKTDRKSTDLLFFETSSSKYF